MSGSDDPPPDDPEQGPVPALPGTGEATEADQPRRRRRAPHRRASSITSTGPAPRPDRPAESLHVPLAPISKARVSLLRARLHDAAGRATLERGRLHRDPRAPPVLEIEPGTRAPGADLMHARSTDQRLRLVRVGKDGVRLFGEGAGKGHGERAPSVSVAIDGAMWSAPVEAGASALDVARALARVLRPRHRCEVVDEGRTAYLRVLA